jgi:hypothetical protein
VRQALAGMAYEVITADFQHTLSPDGQWHPDVVCLDLIDARDPDNASPAGLRWLLRNQDALGRMHVVVLSGVADGDEIRAGLAWVHGVHVRNVIAKSTEAEGGDEWRLELLRALLRIERERIVGAAVITDEHGWPLSLLKSEDGGWHILTVQGPVPAFSTPNRQLLLDRLGAHPFLPLKWNVLYKAVYDTDGAGDAARNRLSQLIGDVRKELGQLVVSGQIPWLDPRQMIVGGTGTYQLNARVVQAERAVRRAGAGGV